MKYLLLLLACVSLNAVAFGGHPPIPAPVVHHATPSLIGTACSTAIQYQPVQPWGPETDLNNTWQVEVRYQGSVKASYDCGGTFSSTIDTAKFTELPTVGGGPDSMLQYTPKPQIPIGKGLEFDANIAIPSSTVTQGRVAQYYLFVYFESVKDDVIAMTVSVFDSRPSALLPESVQWDTAVNFINTHYGSPATKYATTLSGQSTSIPFTPSKPFNVSVSAAQLVAAIQGINQKYGRSLSVSTADWSVSLIGYGAEVAPATAGNTMIQFSVSPQGVFPLP